MDTIDFTRLKSRDQILAVIRSALAGEASLLKRDWHSVTSVVGSSDIRIMQWNILAQALSTSNDNFVKCPPEALRWQKRRLYILEEILVYDADVVCLQEVDHFHFLNSVLVNVGYRGIFKSKLYSPCLNMKPNFGPDGCACFYKLSKLDLVRQTGFVLAPELRRKNQVALLLVFRSLIHSSKFEFGVLVTHMKASVSFKDVRLAQGRSILSHLENSVPGLALVICGDFNASPTEPVYSAFTSSHLKLMSTYTVMAGDGSEPSFTTWQIFPANDAGKPFVEIGKTIDYIWCSSERFAVKGVLKIPTVESIGENRLPSHSYPSDHLSLVVDLNYKS